LKTTSGEEETNSQCAGKVLHRVLHEIFGIYFGEKKLDTRIELNATGKQRIIEAATDKTRFRELVKSLTAEYYHKLAATAAKGSTWTTYLCKELQETAWGAIKKIVTELTHSHFVPFASELEVNAVYELETGEKVKLSGQVDRVDLWQQSNNLWVRVIDYKLGKNKFHPKDIWSGTKVQALFYLAMILRQLRNLGVTARPAGAAYVSLASRFVKVELGAGDSGTMAGPLLQGLFVEEIDVLQAMEPNLEGRLIPVTRKKDGTPKKSNCLFQEDEFAGMEEKLKGLLQHHLAAFATRDFYPNPTTTVDTDNCHSCHFRSICMSTSAQ
jgi:ATP-dependent helicase/nuclease subunit B